MMPIFANPAGLWALLAVPAILAIHFLQQRARIARTSTWFLIEKLAPDSARGRTLERLRSSRQLWLQLLAALLAAWVLAEPRWVQAESAQTVVIVLDASASMDAFRTPALAAVEREMTLAEGLAAHTTWVAMTTNAVQPPLYRGEERLAAVAALERWHPDLGEHDPGPALRLARTLAGAGGRTLLVTDRRTKVPADQRVAGVGRRIDNVGFAGASVARDETGVVWRALVKNHAATAQQRTWHWEAAGNRSAEQTLDLPPGALLEISARLPEGASDALVTLSPDAFTADDRLPLVRPAPKPLTVAVEGTDAAAEFFRKLAAEIDGVGVVSGGAPATLRVARLNAEQALAEIHGGIFWPPADERQQAALAADPVTPARDELVAALNWQGWLGTGPHGFAMRPGDSALLWQGRFPLVFVRPAGEAMARLGVPARKLMLAFDWATSNASRLPATVLLARRFLETERDAQRAPYAANFDSNAPVPIAGGPVAGDKADTPWTLVFQPVTGAPPETKTIPAAERSELRAPGRAGLFTLKRGDELLVRGAAQFADARQGDFKNAETFFVSVPGEREAAIERNTRADPWVPLWLGLIAVALLWSWWSRQSGGVPRGGGVPSPRGDQAALRTTGTPSPTSSLAT